jgi:hypothetical protein
MTYNDKCDLEWHSQRSSIVNFEVLARFRKIHYLKALYKYRIIKIGIYMAMPNVHTFAVIIWPYKHHDDLDRPINMSNLTTFKDISDVKWCQERKVAPWPYDIYFFLTLSKNLSLLRFIKHVALLSAGGLSTNLAVRSITNV